MPQRMKILVDTSVWSLALRYKKQNETVSNHEIRYSFLFRQQPVCNIQFANPVINRIEINIHRQQIFWI